ncbi:hypothetical protein WA556_005599, partial [Blastocystis sp. ATCC 50177/Nand II]
MDRTDLFRKEVQNCKRKAGIALQTDDIIQPKVDVHPSLRRAFVIYNSEQMLIQCIEDYSHRRKETFDMNEDEGRLFAEFDHEVKELLKAVEGNINSFCEEESTLPRALVDEVKTDLKEELTEAKKRLTATKNEHASFLKFSSIIQPTVSRAARTSIHRTKPIVSSSKREELLHSLSEAEQSRLLSESVQIEKSLESELEAVRQVERNAREISELVATFNTHVAQQHEMIDTIHKNTEEAKRDVDKGYEELSKAEQNAKGSTMKLVYLIFACALLLLLLNWMK